MLYLKLIDGNDINDSVYELFQDIPHDDYKFNNPVYNQDKDLFMKQMIVYINEIDAINEKINIKTNRYILYDGDYPIGIVGIRTTLNDFWINSGSQIFYSIRLCERNKGYGNKILSLALKECENLGFEQVRLNCAKDNIASNKIIINNGGILEKKYNSSYGVGNSYIIKL